MKKTNIILFFLLYFVQTTLSAQNYFPEIEWQRCFGSNGEELGYGGNTSVYEYAYSYKKILLLSNGDVLIAMGKHPHAFSTMEGDYVGASALNFTDGYICVARVRPDGSVVWRKLLNGDSVACLLLTQDGNCMLMANGGDNSTFYKIDLAGRIIPTISH
jgi:hypothetical protein